jgi:hypothetical protein
MALTAFGYAKKRGNVRRVGVHIPSGTTREWIRNRAEFWWLEDARWPKDWGGWEFQGALRAEFSRPAYLSVLKTSGTNVSRN